MRKILQPGSAVASLCALALLTGCAGFFSKPTTTTTGTTTTSGGDYVYVVNQATDTLSGFSLGTGALTSIATYALTPGMIPASVAVSIPNTFVFVGGLDAIECFSVGTGGALTAVSGGGATTLANFVSLDVSPDGQWLLALDSTSLNIYIYKINSTTGALALNATAAYGVPGTGTAAQRQIKISPNAAFLIVTLNAGGDVIFTFNTTTGVAASAANLALASGFSDNAVAFDSTSSYVLLARGGTTAGSSILATYSLSSSGALTAVSSVASGNAPYALVVNSTGPYVYAANRGDSTISGYALASGTLTALTSSPYLSGSAVSALAADSSGKYIIAAASGGATDVTLYSLDSLVAGRLDSIATSASGTDPADSIALAATH